MKKVEVVAAIVIHKDLILCTQRDKNKFEYISEKFEFPGGKIEYNETHQEALKRELLEELNIRPIVSGHYLTVVHQYPDFELTMHSYTCETDSFDVSLNEHISHEWLKKDKLKFLDWAAADVPIVKKLMNYE